MRKDTAGQGSRSTTPTWEALEGFVRERAQELIQQIPEQEVTELLGRAESERKTVVDGPEGYRNGHGRPRHLVTSIGAITVRRPRVRGLEERFESRVLPLFARRTKEVGALLPELYLHGLAEGDFELAMRGLLDQAAPLSKPSMRRLREGWAQAFEAWGRRSLKEPGDLGGGPAGMAEGGGAAVLESQDEERAGPASEAGTGGGPGSAPGRGLSSDPDRGAEGQGRVPEAPLPVVPEGRGDPRGGLGPDGEVLRLPWGALEAPEDDPRSGKARSPRSGYARRQLSGSRGSSVPRP